MALSTLVGTTTQPTGGAGATRVITTTFRPKLALFAWVTDGSLDTIISGTTVADPSLIGFGAAADDSGVTYATLVNASADGLATSDNSRYLSNAACFVAVNSSTFAVTASATAAFNATDLTLTFGTNDNVARNIAYLLIGGGSSSVRFKCVDWQSGTAAGSVAVTTVGWQPTFAIDLNAGSLNTTAGGTTGQVWGAGFRASASQEVAFFVGSSDAAGTAVVAKAQRDDSFNATYANSNNVAPTHRVEHTSFDSTGFTVNVATFNSNRRHFAIVGAGVDAAVGMLDKSTGANGSTQDVTAQGWTPEAMVLQTVSSVTQATAGNSVSASNVSSGLSVGFWDGASSEACVGYFDVHGPTNMVVKNIASASKVLVKSENNAPTVQAQADASAVSGGVRLTWSTNDAVAADIGYLFLRETPSGASETAELAAAGAATAAFAAAVAHPAALATAGQSAASLAARAAHPSALATAGQSTAAFAATTVRTAAVAASGQATAAFAPVVANRAALATAGTATAAFAGRATHPAALATAAQSSATLAAAATHPAALAAAGQSTAAFVGNIAGECFTFDVSVLDGPDVLCEEEGEVFAALAAAGASTAAVAAAVARPAALATAAQATASFAPAVLRRAALATAGQATAALAAGTSHPAALAAAGQSAAALAATVDGAADEAALLTSGTATAAFAPAVLRRAAVAASGQSAAALAPARAVAGAVFVGAASGAALAPAVLRRAVLAAEGAAVASFAAEVAGIPGGPLDGELSVGPVIEGILGVGPALDGTLLVLPALGGSVEVAGMANGTPYVGETLRVKVRGVVHDDLNDVTDAALTVTVTGPGGAVAVGAVGRRYNDVWVDFVPTVAGEHTVKAEATKSGAVLRERTTVEVEAW